jgi:glutaredoxin
MSLEHVDGKNKGKIMLYALSTCVWCRKTRLLLDSLGVEYSYIYMDLIRGREKENNLTDLEKWNPRCSYPTIVINDKKCIVGFKPEEIKEVLKI